MVEGGGFEPPKAEPSDLQSDPFGRSGTPPFRKNHYDWNQLFCQFFYEIILYENAAPALPTHNPHLAIRIDN